MTPVKPDPSDLSERSSARLAAAQALYIVDATGAEPEQVIKDFLIGRLGGLAVTEDADTAQETTVSLTSLDSELFINLVRTVQARGEDIDTIRDLLRCSTNNRAETPGGPGERVQPPAPPFAD